MSIFPTGFRNGSPVTVSVAGGGSASVATFGVPDVPIGGDTFSENQWTLEDEGSAAANGIARLDFTSLPVRIGWQADSFIVESNDGTTTTTHFIHWGATLN